MREVTIYMSEVAAVDDSLQVFCGYFHGNLRFGGRGGGTSGATTLHTGGFTESWDHRQRSWRSRATTI